MVRREIGKDPIDGDLKNRASRAYVACIRKSSGKLVSSAISMNDPFFVYHVGKTVKPRSPFNRTKEQCASGIHFYETALEARRL